MRLKKLIKHYECKSEDGRIFRLSQPYTQFLLIPMIRIKVVYFIIFKKLIWERVEQQ